MAISQENSFIATLTEKDRYNYKIHIPRELSIPKPKRKPEIYSFNTGSTNPVERLFNVEYLHAEEISNTSDFLTEIIVSKKIAEEIGLKKGDSIEIVKINEDIKTIFFCSDTTKKEHVHSITDNLKNKMKNKKLLSS